MNGNSNSSKTSGRDESREAFVVKPSNIRIWIHDKDVGKLTRVLWAGHGNRLRTETSTNPRVKKFLETVPYVMNVIKDVQQAVVDNNLDLLKAKTEPPVPPSLITTKDANGLTVMHKAAGLAHTRIVEHLLKVWPGGATDIDATGKTPLHWAASAKNNTRCYNLLVQSGADEEALDYRMKTASYYKSKPHDIDRSMLTIVPEAPRVPMESQTDWSTLVDEVGKLTDSQTDLSSTNENNNNKEEDQEDLIGGNGINLLTSRAQANTIEDTSEPDEIADEQNNLTIEEQAIKDAIEDERIFEQTQSEKDDQQNEEDPVENNDVNGNSESLGNPTPSPPPTTTVQEIEDQEAKTNGHWEESPQEIDSNQNNHENKVEDADKVNASDKTANLMENDTSDHPKDAPEPNEIDTPVSAEAIKVNENPPVDAEPPIEPDTSAVLEKPTSAVSEKPTSAGVAKEAETENSSLAELGDTTKLDNKENHDETGKNEPEPTNLEEELVALNPLPKDEPVQETSAEAKEGGIKNDEDNENKKGDKTSLEHVMNAEDHGSSETEKTDLIKADIDDFTDKAIEYDKQETKTVNDDKEGNEKTTNNDVHNPYPNEISKTPENEISEPQNVLTIDDIKTPTNLSRNGSASSTRSRTPNGNLTFDGSHPSSNKSSATSQRARSGAKTPNKEATTNGDKDKESDEENDKEDTKENGLPYGSIDENHNAVKLNGTKSLTPPSPELEYEGLVHGEADDNQVQSQSGGYFVNEVDRIQTVIDSGDMEQLAALVLNGEGKKLLGTNSQQPEIQAFLDNVPSYMNKIRIVHQAARNGNIRDLQAALDRRKFAIAKDEISPDGATPLHVATIFGHASIIRYLGGRFPETTSAMDDNGRTALHYAATINDNGHFYNLLVNLGSNPKSIDKLGNSAEHYKDNREDFSKVFSYRKLLQVFGADENLENEMLSDQVPDDLHSARRPVDDADILSTLERCFRLLHEPVKKNDPLGSGTPSSATSLRVNVTTYLARFLKRSVFEKIKHRQTRLDHNLFDVIWPAMKKSSKERRIDEDLNAGVVAPDFDVYVVFQEFLVPLIKDMHSINLSYEFKPHPRMFYFPVVDGKIDNNLKVNIDETKKFIVDGYIECSRNLDDFELPLNLNIGQIEHAERVVLEKILTAEFSNTIGDAEPGNYYTMNEVLESPSEIRTVLAASKLLIPLLDSSDPIQEPESLAINGQYWPYGRGVFVNNVGDLAVWINVQEHLRIVVSTPSNAPAHIGYAYSKIGRAMMYLDEKLHFRESYLLGFLSSRPSYLGTGLKLSVSLELPSLMKEIDNLRHLCSVRGLNMIANTRDGTARVVNMQSLGITEWRIFQDYCTAVTNILQLEKDMSFTNSKQIAAMLVKIFRRKKNSLVDS